MPFLPLFDSEHACVLDLLLEFRFVNVSIVLCLQVDLMVRDDLVVRQSYLRIDEVLVAMHEQW